MISTIGFILIGIAAVIQIIFLLVKKHTLDPVSHYLLAVYIVYKHIAREVSTID